MSCFKNWLTILFLICSLTSVFASETDYQSEQYLGNRSDLSFDLRTEINRTENRRVQVPYTERVCQSETRYRQECHMEPGRRVCRTVKVPVCQNRRVCRRGPNGRNICENRRVCRNESRQECRTLPAQRVCRQVPYRERVCRNVTRYRWEDRPVTVVDRYIEAHVNFKIESSRSRGPLDVMLNGSLYRDALSISSTNNSQNEHLVLSNKTESRRVVGRTTYINVEEQVEVVSANEYFSHMLQNARPLSLRSGLLQVQMPKIFDSSETYFALIITTRNGIIFRRELSAFEYTLSRINSMDVMLVRLDQLLGPLYHRYRGSEILIDISTQIRPKRRILNLSQFSSSRFIGNTRFGIFLD